MRYRAASNFLCRGLPMMLALLTAGSAAVAAHDMWIEPTAFAPDVNGIIGVRLRVGQDFLGDPISRDPALIKEFVVVDSAGRRPLYGRDGADPAGLLRIPASGLFILGYSSNPSPVVLTAEKFNQYLRDEGLDMVAQLRARRGQTNAVAQEIFSRCAKSLVLSGRPTGSQGDRPLGFTLELVAERNPYMMVPGQDLPVRLTYHDRPLPGALVVAINRASPTEKVASRSDSNGRVRLRLARPGEWLVKAVHMVPAPPDGNAEWASYWASLTFELAPR